VATNSYGDSAESESGNGAIYTTVPDAPISVAEDVAYRTSTTMGLSWSDGSNNGGVAIIDYRIN
jgi:hypothetical protein